MLSPHAARVELAQSGMTFTALAPHCVHTKRRHDAIEGNPNSSGSPSDAKPNVAER
jgi:hypothetical protein